MLKLIKSPFIQTIMNEDNPVEILVHLIEDIEHGPEVILTLRDIGDRKALVPLLELAEKASDETKELCLQAISAFNCEEYVDRIVQVGIKGNFNCRMHVYRILHGMTTISSQLKNTSLNLILNERERLLKKREVDQESILFIESCADIILELPFDSQVKTAKILAFKK